MLTISDEENNMIYNKTQSMMLLQPVKRNLTMTPKQRLHSYVDELILDKAKRGSDGYYLSLDNLDDDEQGQLAVLLLEVDDRDTTDCFHEDDKYTIDDNITCALLNLLKNDSTDNREDLATLIRNNTIKKYSKRMESLLDEHCNDMFVSEMNDAGYSAYHHNDNDEIYWSRHA
jgi:hypothetical protein